MQRENGAGIPITNIVYRLLAVGVAFIALTQLGHNVNSIRLPSGGTRNYVLDDSMITLRVADNFAHGEGPYFNVGEHTAANTSLFWPLLLSLRFHHGIDLSEAISSLSYFSSFLCLAILVVVALSADSTMAACIALFFLAISPCFLEYGASVWEHIPQSLLVTVAFCVYLGKIGRLNAWREEIALLLLALAFLVRPDSLPLYGIFLLVVLLKFYRRRSWATFVCVFLSLVPIGFYFVLHHSFYGSFVPNTYYLKVNLGVASIKAGLHYLVRSASSSIVPLFIAYLAVFSFREKKSLVTSENLVVIACFVLQVCYIVIVGGDFFDYGRFFILLAPITCLLFCESLSRLTSRDYVRASASIIIVILALQAFSTFRQGIAAIQVSTDHGIMIKEDPQAAQASMVEFLQKNFSPNDGQIGLSFLGTLSYYMPQYQFADFLGKADSHIAHEAPKWGPVGHDKWDVQYSLIAHHISAIPIDQREADYNFALSVVRSRRDFGYLGAIVTDPYTLAHYTYFSPDELNISSTWGLIVRNDLVQKLKLDKSQATSNKALTPPSR